MADRYAEATITVRVLAPGTAATPTDRADVPSAVTGRCAAGGSTYVLTEAELDVLHLGGPVLVVAAEPAPIYSPGFAFTPPAGMTAATVQVQDEGDGRWRLLVGPGDAGAWPLGTHDVEHVVTVGTDSCTIAISMSVTEYTGETG